MVRGLRIVIILFVVMILNCITYGLNCVNSGFSGGLSDVIMSVAYPLLILSSIVKSRLPSHALVLPLLNMNFLACVLLLIFKFKIPQLVDGGRSSRKVVNFTLVFTGIKFVKCPVISDVFKPGTVFCTTLLGVPGAFFVFATNIVLVGNRCDIGRFGPGMLLDPTLVTTTITTLLMTLKMRAPSIVTHPMAVINGIAIPTTLVVVKDDVTGLPLGRVVNDPGICITSLLHLMIIPLDLCFFFGMYNIDSIIGGVGAIIVTVPMTDFNAVFYLGCNEGPTLVARLAFVAALNDVLAVPLVALLFK